MPCRIKDFREIWVVDFEFRATPGERPVPICLVARRHPDGVTIRMWEDELRKLARPPFPIDSGSLLVAYYASAEIGCFLSLGWPLPAYILDLFVEFRNQTNGRPLPSGAGLLGALVYHGIDAMSVVHKDSMRDLALRGGPWTDEERRKLLDYCEEDVLGLERLLRRMAPNLDLRRALLRGRYMSAAARMEHIGIPIDAASLCMLRANWSVIKDRLIERIDADYGVFEGQTFKRDRWAKWLATGQIPWPRRPSGNLALDDDTFREMALRYPEVQPIRDLRATLSKLRLESLAVGTDGRNRCILSAFRSSTGRNQPSTSKFIFGPAVWLRSLIRPEPGFALAYIDWSQQEFGIAAALSGDDAMMNAYESGDPYLEFAKQAGTAPAAATKATHGRIRDVFKECALAVQYGMGPYTLAERIGQSVVEARSLLALYRRTYPRFWKWSDSAVDYAMLKLEIHTVFGWTLYAGSNVNSRSVRNFPMQANGAEMLRLACSLATERGIRVCAPIHDAILIEAPLGEIDYAVAAAQRAMSEASAAVLDGFLLRSDVDIVRYPERYLDERGRPMWEIVHGLLAEIEAANSNNDQGDPCTGVMLPAQGRTPGPSISISHI